LLCNDANAWYSTPPVIDFPGYTAAQIAAIFATLVGE
jgi:hypothetical protein